MFGGGREPQQKGGSDPISRREMVTPGFDGSGDPCLAQEIGLGVGGEAVVSVEMSELAIGAQGK